MLSGTVGRHVPRRVPGGAAAVMRRFIRCSQTGAVCPLCSPAEERSMGRP